MKKTVILAVLMCVYTLSCNSQKMPMGGWRTHMSYSDISKIVETKSKVFGISSGALFSVYKDDYTTETYSKLFGLSDNGIHTIEYSKENELLVIVYDNSNIDLLTDDNEIFNVSDIYRKTLVSSKTVNSVSFDGHLAYLATDFGIVVLNLEKYEVVDTYMIGDGGSVEKVLDVFVKDKIIYALTANKILYANTQGSNLVNYNNWSKFEDPDITVENTELTKAGEYIYLVKADMTMYRYGTGGWTPAGKGVTSVMYDDGVLFVRDEKNKISVSGAIQVDDDLYAFNLAYDERHNAIWYSTSEAVMKYDVARREYLSFAPNGPASNMAGAIYFHNGKIYTVPGGRVITTLAIQNNKPASVSIYENGRWKNIDNSQLLQFSPIDRSLDFSSMAFDPEDETHYWVASFGTGLYEFRNDVLVMQYTHENSDIETYWPDKDYLTQHLYIRVDALTYDSHGNLWMYNFSPTSNQLKFIDKYGNFNNIKYSAIQNLETLQEILQNKDNVNQKIALFPRYRSNNDSFLFVFDDNGTPADIRDDRTLGLTDIYDQDQNRIRFNDKLLRSIAQDKDGVIWVGTTAGLFLMSEVEKIFDGNYTCSRIKIPRNDGSGLADYLLETESIVDIAVDGANRKWLATETSGVYLVSEDGLETIHHFTTENSPLLSDNVRSVGINDDTGEVFFGTTNGVISYQSDAVKAGVSFNNVHAYPNPVRPEYTGLITIIGLTENTNVRITDVNGNMIYETLSNGGVATWDGCRRGGGRVATGVYFAHCVSADRKNKIITKILIIN